MATKIDFNADEWDKLRQLPLLAGLLVVAASPSGPIGLVQESSAASLYTKDAFERAKSPLMQALAADWKENLHIPRLEGQSPEDIHTAGLAACRDGAAILRAKASDEESSEFKCWVIELATHVAEAAKEGGFLGFGGVRVTPEETAILDQIQVALR